jgi:hypothetical protein
VCPGERYMIKAMEQKTALLFGGGVIVGALLISVWFTGTDSQNISPTSTNITTSTDTSKKSTWFPFLNTNNTTEESGPLSIPSPQDPGLQIAISHITVSELTWVVVYENRGGQPGNALGAALFTPDRQSGVVELLRGTLPGQTYLAGQSRDDGDHIFSLDNDPPVRDAKGDPVFVEFRTR